MELKLPQISDSAKLKILHFLAISFSSLVKKIGKIKNEKT
jgi:hypothetical protein